VLFNSNYAITIIIALLRFLLYSLNAVQNGYYLHLVSCLQFWTCSL